MGSPALLGRIPLLERIMRWVLLVILTISALVTIGFMNAPHRSVADFTTALHQHRVGYVKVTGDGDGVKVLWTTGWTGWATTKATATPSGKPVDLVALGGSDLPFWSRDQIKFGSMVLTDTEDPLPFFLGWADLIALLVMLFNGGGWIGNRWFWWWIFVVPGLGLTGPILYLLLERQPLWIIDRKPLPDKPAFGGVASLIILTALGIALGLAEFLLSLAFG